MCSSADAENYLFVFRRPEIKRRRREREEEEQQRQQQEWQRQMEQWQNQYPPVNTQPVPQMPPAMNVNPPMETPMYMPHNPPIVSAPPPVQIIPVVYADIPKQTSASNDQATGRVRKPKRTIKTSYMVVRENRVAPGAPSWPANNARIITQDGIPYLSAPVAPQTLSVSQAVAPQDQSQC